MVSAAVSAHAGQSGQGGMPSAGGEAMPNPEPPPAAASPDGISEAPQSMFSAELLGSEGWQRDDYQVYMSLTQGLGNASAQPGGAQAAQPGGQGSPEVDPAADSQRLAQESIEALNRVWSYFDADSVSRSELKAFIAGSRIQGGDRATLSRLVEDDQAFNWLDRLGATFTDGRITQDTVGRYAVGDSLPAPAEPNRQSAQQGTGTGTPADSLQSGSQAPDAGAHAQAGAGQNSGGAPIFTPANVSGEAASANQALATSSPEGAINNANLPTAPAAVSAVPPAEGQPAAGTDQPAEAAANPPPFDIRLFDVLSRNFGMFGHGAAAASPDLAVTRDDLTASLNSVILDNQTREAFSFLASDEAQFAALDGLDGASDGRITWAGLLKAQGQYLTPQNTDPTEGAMFPNQGGLQDAPSVETVSYSPIFFAGANLLGSEDGHAFFNAVGELDLEGMRNADHPTLRELANDPMAFKLFDALDGTVDSRVSRQGMIELTRPGSMLFDTKIKGEDGQEVDALTAVYSEMGNKYDDFKLPDLPDGVNNDHGRAYRSAFALADNLPALIGEKLELAAEGKEILITVDDLKNAASNESISTEDRVVLAEIANDTALFDWMCGVGDGGEASSIPLERLANIVSDWNRANFNSLRVAYGMLDSGIPSLAKSEAESTGFERGMTPDEVATKVMDPAALTKAYNRMMADPVIQADMREAFRKVLPDAQGMAQGMSRRLESEFYVGYADWLRTNTNSDGVSARIGGEIYALKLLDPDLAEATGTSLAGKLFLRRAQATSAEADEKFAAEVLTLLLEKVAKDEAIIRISRTSARMTGNLLSLVFDAAKIPGELERLANALVPSLLRPWQPGYEAIPEAHGDIGKPAVQLSRFEKVLQQINNSGAIGSLAAVLGSVLGVMMLHRRASDDKASTLEERLSSALAVVAPLSYGTQVLKSANMVLDRVFGSDFLTRVTIMASKPVYDLSPMGWRSEVLKDLLQKLEDWHTAKSNRMSPSPTNVAQVAESLPNDPLNFSATNRSLAGLLRLTISGLDMAGGAITAVLGGMQIHDARKTGDKVDLAAGSLLTAGGGLWLLGGVASLATVGIASPFFVLSGIVGLAGLITGMFSDPSKKFAQNFGEQFESLEAAGVMRENWREFASNWYKDHHVDERAGTGLGLDV